MHGNPKIDLEELQQMLDAGKSKKECAAYFNVTPPAITQALKRHKNAITVVTAIDKVPAVIEAQLDTVGQLNKINRDANEILDLVMRWTRGDEEAIRVLETQVKKVKWRRKHIGENEEEKDKELDVEEIKFKDPRELALKAMAEIRNQLRLQLEIYQTLYDVQAAEEFQKEVLHAIGEVSPDVRDAIIRRLKENRAIRAAIEHPGSNIQA